MNAHPIRSQSGAALLLVLLTMLSGGALLMASWVSTSVPLERQRDRARVLGAARESLLAYAVGYIDLYGPRGAGPGHLPCPDTDPMDNAPDALSWLGDGPNPPCGHGSVALGRLPRHVSRPGHRYGFHGLPRQELWYAVSTAFVNNPVNRVVNPASRGGLQLDDTDDIVALVIDPGRAFADQNRRVDSPAAWLEGENADGDTVFSRLQNAVGNDRIAALRMRGLRKAMTRRVGLWLRDQLRVAAAARCTGSTASEPAWRRGTTPVAAARTTREGLAADAPAARACRPFAAGCDRTDLIAWLTPSSEVCRAPADSASGHTALPVDTGARASSAALTPAASEAWLLDGVPWQTHWFVRNRWPEHANLQIHEACHDAAFVACGFRLLPAVPDQRSIRVALEPRSASNDADTASLTDAGVAQ